MTLKAPFPYYGGKSRVASEVWSRFGAVDAYIEPFCGSAAMLLARPGEVRGSEVVNDKDYYVANFWRAMAAEPDTLAELCDWPVNEADLHARHLWLVNEGRERIIKCYDDLDFYDVKVAAYWAWGLSQWIGSGWCAHKEPWEQVPYIAAGKGGCGVHAQGVEQKRPVVAADNQGRGVHRKGLKEPWQQLPDLNHDRGVATKRPMLRTTSYGDTGGNAVSEQVPNLFYRGAGGVNTRLPNVDARGGTGTVSNDPKPLTPWFRALATRLRRVKVTCGDWQRVLGPSVLGTVPSAQPGIRTAIFFDPPYSAAAGRASDIYSHDDLDVAHAVRAWCEEHGGDARLRIALCGYEGEGHEALEALGWTCHAWKTQGGMAHGRAVDGLVNAARERVWFSPACLAGAAEAQGTLEL